MRGVYTVFLVLDEDSTIDIGALGEKEFERGVYVYVGSAMNSVETRVWRHFSRDKKLHWHIDYFSRKARAFAFSAFATGSDMECVMASSAREKAKPVEGFGASDCNCESHLFRIGDQGSLPENVLTGEHTG